MGGVLEHGRQHHMIAHEEMPAAAAIPEALGDLGQEPGVLGLPLARIEEPALPVDQVDAVDQRSPCLPGSDPLGTEVGLEHEALEPAQTLLLALEDGHLDLL